MPPKRLTMMTGFRAARSIVIAQYASLAISSRSSTSTDLIGSPCGFCRFGGIGVAMISSATLRPCAAPAAILILPALPRPPIRTCAFTTHSLEVLFEKLGYALAA